MCGSSDLTTVFQHGGYNVWRLEYKTLWWVNHAVLPQRLCAVQSVWGWREEGDVPKGVQLLQPNKGEGPKRSTSAHRPELPPDPLQREGCKRLLVLLHLRHHQEFHQGSLCGRETGYGHTELILSDHPFTCFLFIVTKADAIDSLIDEMANLPYF